MLASAGLLFDAMRLQGQEAGFAQQRADKDARVQLASQKRAVQSEQDEKIGRSLDAAAKQWLGIAGFPWDELMLSLERLQLHGLRLMSISVDPKEGNARIVLECRTVAEAAEVVGILNEGRESAAKRWRLVRVQISSEAGRAIESEVRFR